MMEMFSQEMGVLLPVLLKQLMNVLFHLSGNLYVRKFVEMENQRRRILKFVTTVTQIQEMDVHLVVQSKLFTLAQTLPMHSQFAQISVEMISYRHQQEKCVTMEILEEETDAQPLVKLKQAIHVLMQHQLILPAQKYVEMEICRVHNQKHVMMETMSLQMDVQALARLKQDGNVLVLKD